MRKTLDEREFRVLVALDEHKGRLLTQREIAAKTHLSLGSVNKTMTGLHERGMVCDGVVLQAGIDALEPYRVKRAIFIAAGFGSRLVPITLNTPKPLIRVQGRRIIDSLLDAVEMAGIEEIYLVRGYLSEQFDQLLYQHPNIKFIENPLYNEANNISSLVAAKNLLSNAYVLESDLLLYNPKLITKYQFCSNYLGVPVEKTDDWCFETRRGIITRLSQGGTHCHHMFGISYWTEDDGQKLAHDISATFAMPGGKERYWDEVTLHYFAQNYEVRVRECSFDDIIEIDTFHELQNLDKAYAV